jgi:hypothetical protein
MERPIDAPHRVTSKRPGAHEAGERARARRDLPEPDRASWLPGKHHQRTPGAGLADRASERRRLPVSAPSPGNIGSLKSATRRIFCAAATSADYALPSLRVRRYGYWAPQRRVCYESFACYVRWSRRGDRSRLSRSWTGSLGPRLPSVIPENVAECVFDLQICPSRRFRPDISPVGADRANAIAVAGRRCQRLAAAGAVSHRSCSPSPRSSRAYPVRPVAGLSFIRVRLRSAPGPLAGASCRLP